MSGQCVLQTKGGATRSLYVDDEQPPDRLNVDLDHHPPTVNPDHSARKFMKTRVWLHGEDDPWTAWYQEVEAFHAIDEDEVKVRQGGYGGKA